MCDDLAVRGGTEDASLFFKTFPQCLVIVNDAVMDDIKLSFGITMRMCIDVRGLSVSRPAGVRNAVSCRVEELRNGIADGILQRFHLADAFHALHITAGAYGNAGGIVSPVFKSFQAVDQDSCGGAHTGISNDSTHMVQPPFFCCRT